jgi:halimadienyl-diphosphate synthase
MVNNRQAVSWTRATWQEHVQPLIDEMGPGLITASAYDTAWVARLVEQDKALGEAALEWLSSHQLSDGSWGTKDPVCYYDRVICTLSAMTTLARYGRRAQDRKLIANGQVALGELTSNATRRLMTNPASATVGFEMLAPTLVGEAEELGILNNQGDRILGKLQQLRKLKLAKLGNKRIDRSMSAAFSVEMVGEDLTRLDNNNLSEENGSIAYSPAATAYYLLRVQPGNSAAMAYLNRVQIGGAFPYVGPVDIFECAWSLWNLGLTEWSECLQDSFQHHLDTLEHAWIPGRGVGAATGLSLIDGDDSAMAFEAMHRWGRFPDADSLLSYESDEHFLCFRMEADPSTSTNIHLLSALKAGGFDRKHPSVQKILNFLLSRRMGNGMWSDKWHLSPYYPTAHAIIACAGYAEELVEGAVEHILASQKSDGTWGDPHSTAEETAYALQALCVWKRSGHPVDEAVLRVGAAWLVQQVNRSQPLLWIGKCLYSPVRVVTATILSALGMVMQDLGGEL